jgi:hypothetical protein
MGKCRTIGAGEGSKNMRTIAEKMKTGQKYVGAEIWERRKGFWFHFSAQTRCDFRRAWGSVLVFIFLPNQVLSLVTQLSSLLNGLRKNDKEFLGRNMLGQKYGEGGRDSGFHVSAKITYPLR